MANQHKPVVFDGREINLSEISRETGLDVSHVSRIMRGEKDPSLKAIQKIAYSLRMAPDYFVDQLLLQRGDAA